MFKSVVSTAAVAFALVSAPASAATVVFNLGGATAEATSFSYAAGGLQLNVSASGFAVAPQALDLATEIGAAKTVRREAGGLGINSAEGAGQREQVDNDGPNELLRLAVAGRKSRLVSAKFNFVDDNDTLRVYGVNGGVLTLLGLAGTTGFTGEFVDNTAADAPLGNGATVTARTPGGLSNAIVFDVAFSNKLGKFDSFLFTAQNDAADGYRLQQVALGVPEPAAWAMMLGGFGLVGGMMRRRQSMQVTYA
jgi:hypothetical protein